MTATDPEWVVDDEDVPDEATLFRRVPDQPDFLDVDLNGGPPRLGLGVFSYKDEDGMSVYVSSRMKDEDISDEELIDWKRVYLCRFPVATVRRADAATPYPDGTAPVGSDTETAGGVVLDVASFPDDERVQRSHGLVRIPIPPKAAGWRPMWNAFRIKLMQATHVKVAKSADWIVPTTNGDPARST